MPHPALRPYVASWVGFRAALDPRAVHHGLPSPTLTVVLALDEPLDVGWLDRGERERYWTCVAGLHTGPALVRTHGWQHGIQLALTPLGARALLGAPAAALAATMTEHAELPVGLPQCLLENLAAQRDWRRRHLLLERHLLSVLARRHDDPAHDVRPEVARAWWLIACSGGRARVADVAEQVGWGRRRLLEQFRAEVGVGPKEAGRIVRFDRSRRLLDAGIPLAEVADRAGYADQAHLSREYARLAGRSPSRLRESAYHLPG